jgi:hypothetical protein
MTCSWNLRNPWLVRFEDVDSLDLGAASCSICLVPKTNRTSRCLRGELPITSFGKPFIFNI